MPKKLIPLVRPSLPSADSRSLRTKLDEVFKSGQITEGKYVRLFEKQAAKFLGAKEVIAVSNGTSALLLTLSVLNLRGEVILPSFTYSSGGHILLWCGLKPVFADIDPHTFTLDPKDVERKVSKNTVAILPTHTFGNPCDIDTLQKIANRHNLKVVYDGAHSFGSLYHRQPLGQFGDATIYSLTPTKVLTTGEGGLIATNNKLLASKLRLAKLNGDSFNRNEEFLGLTSRMSEFQAILGIENLKTLKKQLRKRRLLVDFYKKQLSNIKEITFQQITPGSDSIFKDLTIIVNRSEKGVTRDELLGFLRQNNIQTKVYFDPPLHQKKVYQKYSKTLLPNTSYVTEHIMNLPLYAHLPFRDAKYVCDTINRLYQSKQ